MARAGNSSQGRLQQDQVLLLLHLLLLLLVPLLLLLQQQLIRCAEAFHKEKSCRQSLV